jgi:transposase
VQQYSAAFKARVVRRLVGPQAVSANRLSSEVGVSQVSLSRWLHEARSVDGMPKRDRKKWTGAEKLRVVMASEGSDETEVGALLRREGLHAAQLTEWRAAAEAALGPPARVARTDDAVRIQDLERELRRKDRALAETAALLVLKKKVQEIWGDADDITDPRSAR